MKRYFFSAVIAALIALISLTAPAWAEDEPGLLAEDSFIADARETMTEESIMDELPETAAEETVDLPSAISNDALAEQYIQSSLPRRRMVLRVSRPSGLIQFAENTANRNLYLAIREKVTAAANGTSDEIDVETGGISTVFSFSTDDIFPTIDFTAEDLGVDALYDEEGNLTSEVKAALANIATSSISFRDVALCVFNDSPYELYWSGRYAAPTGQKKGWTTLSALNYSKTTKEKVGLKGTYEVQFDVYRDYAVIPSDWDSSTKLYSIDPEKCGSVVRARETINTIRTEVSGMDDFEMMSYFADWICSHVSYNSAAVKAHQADSTVYGDPWQLVWVFDQESEQKVVCEGYSKAFAYLCDLCTEKAEAIIVWGTIPQGAHMWNVVSIDGHNYLVDLTNHKSYLNLFLVGAEGSVEAGYRAGSIFYQYNRAQTTRTDEELTLEKYSYAEWKEATESAPAVRISSSRTYPGYRVAIRASSKNGVLPVEQLVMIRDGETEIDDGGSAELELNADTEIRFAAVIDGRTSPETEEEVITVAELPENEFILPAGSTIEAEAFSGMGASLIQVNGNQIESNAFDEEAVLAVDAVGDWFESGYQFVIRTEEVQSEGEGEG